MSRGGHIRTSIEAPARAGCDCTSSFTCTWCTAPANVKTVLTKHTLNFRHLFQNAKFRKNKATLDTSSPPAHNHYNTTKHLKHRFAASSVLAPRGCARGYISLCSEHYKYCFLLQQRRQSCDTTNMSLPVPRCRLCPTNASGGFVLKTHGKYSTHQRHARLFQPCVTT